MGNAINVVQRPAGRRNALTTFRDRDCVLVAGDGQVGALESYEPVVGTDGHDQGLSEWGAMPE